MNSKPRTLPIIRKPKSLCMGCRRGIRMKVAKTGERIHVGEHGSMAYECREPK